MPASVPSFSFLDSSTLIRQNYYLYRGFSHNQKEHEVDVVVDVVLDAVEPEVEVDEEVLVDVVDLVGVVGVVDSVGVVALVDVGEEVVVVGVEVVVLEEDISVKLCNFCYFYLTFSSTTLLVN
jgi:hypothetical protein